MKPSSVTPFRRKYSENHSSEHAGESNELVVMNDVSQSPMPRTVRSITDPDTNSWVVLSIYFDKIEIMKSPDAIVSLGALAQESRLSIFRLLVKRGPDGFTPGDLVAKTDIAAPTLSFHLKELQRAELVSVRRDGRFLYYSANFVQMQALVDFLTENCCSLADARCDTSCQPSTASPKRKRA